MGELERTTWGFTRLSDTEEQCNVCGILVSRRAAEMKLHRDFHAALERQQVSRHDWPRAVSPNPRLPGAPP
jgi:hypothetical protein